MRERQYTLVLGDSCPRSTIIRGFEKHLIDLQKEKLQSHWTANMYINGWNISFQVMEKVSQNTV